MEPAMHRTALVTLNMRELDRLKVIQAVVDLGLKPGRAAERLGLTVRQIERLVIRYRESGAAGLTSRKRGGPGNRRLDAELAQRALTIIRDRYADFRADAGSETAGKGVTQFGRALHELNVDAFCANSSQAKGRVERADLTLQDRLVEELRLRGISTREAANAYAPSFIADFNRRFGKPPKRGRESGACCHRGAQS
ncbi:hypothetical protein WI97_00005 [Burkholderia vietnamiensis]|nr:hypothetical protein WI97_00005 [Burkholderia vietnamiensis]